MLGRVRCAELVGKPGLGHDKMSRTLGLYARLELAYQTLDDYSKQSLDSYAASVNAYLNRNATLPLEMQLLGLTLETSPRGDQPTLWCGANSCH